MKRRIVAYFLTLVFAICLFPQFATVTRAAGSEQGSWGAHLNWTLNTAGTLTISGQGAIPDFDLGESPFARNDTIRSVVIGEGVTGIGKGTFFDCSKLQSVTFPASLTEIGSFAFVNCDALTAITVPDTVTFLGTGAFYGCSGLTSATISGSVTHIGDAAFSDCDSLTRLMIAVGVASIGESAFSGCDSLTGVYFRGNEAQWNEITIGSDNDAIAVAQKYLDCEKRTGEFVDRLYQTCMGRDPDADGRAYWINRLLNGEVTGGVAAYGFVFSREFKNKNLCNTDFLKQLYVAMMGRQADQAGLDFWFQEMLKGMTREDVFSRFVRSKEFADICQRYGIDCGDGIELPQLGTIPMGNCAICGAEDGITTFVKRLYTQIHGRQPDQEGLDYWVSELRSRSRTGGNVAYGFIFSKEFEGKNYNDEQFLTKLYLALMGRNPDEGGMNYYLAEMENGLTRNQAFDAFVRSIEFSKICNNYGIMR